MYFCAYFSALRNTLCSRAFIYYSFRHQMSICCQYILHFELLSCSFVSSFSISWVLSCILFCTLEYLMFKRHYILFVSTADAKFASSTFCFFRHFNSYTFISTFCISQVLSCIFVCNTLCSGAYFIIYFHTRCQFPVSTFCIFRHFLAHFAIKHFLAHFAVSTVALCPFLSS